MCRVWRLQAHPCPRQDHSYEALNKVEHPDLSAAVLDHELNDGDTSQICDRLDQRNIPFVIYSGYDYVEGPCSEGEHVRKPVRPEVLVATVINVLRDRERAR